MINSNGLVLAADFDRTVVDFIEIMNKLIRMTMAIFISILTFFHELLYWFVHDVSLTVKWLTKPLE